MTSRPTKVEVKVLTSLASVTATIELRDAGLQLDVAKCEFEVQAVRYLGFVIEAGIGVSMQPEKVKAIMEWGPSLHPWCPCLCRIR